MNKEREHKVKIEKFHRPTNLRFIARMDKVLNLTGIAREVKSCDSKQTFVSRVNRGTSLISDVEKKAFAEDVGEVFNEMWYIIGVALGKFPRDQHKKFKYFWNDDSDRAVDAIEKLEEEISDG